MKTKIILINGFLAVLFFCFGCDKEDNNSFNYIGNWVNEKNDTIFFYQNDPGETDGLLIFKNFSPYYTILYSYSIKKDSIFLFPSHSSSLNNWKGYPIQCETNEFILFQYNNTEKSIYKCMTSN